MANQWCFVKYTIAIIIGEGSAEEVANDALFSVTVQTKGQQNVAQPLVITVTDAKGKVLAKRSYTAVLTNDAGRMHAALWVKDIGCAGAVLFVAKLGPSSQTTKLDFACGE